MSTTAEWEVNTNILLCAHVSRCAFVFMTERRTVMFTLLVFADYSAYAVVKMLGWIMMLTPSNEADTAGVSNARRLA